MRRWHRCLVRRDDFGDWHSNRESPPRAKERVRAVVGVHGGHLKPPRAGRRQPPLPLRLRLRPHCEARKLQLRTQVYLIPGYRRARDAVSADDAGAAVRGELIPLPLRVLSVLDRGQDL